MKNFIRNTCHLLIFISLSLFLFSCSKSHVSHSKQLSLKKLTVHKDLAISAGMPDVKIGSFGDLAVDKKGNIYISDPKLLKIHIFTSDGHYDSSIGQKGKGPGEFSSIDNKIKIIKDTLYVQDFVQRRIDLFNIHNKTWIRSINLPNAKLNGVSLGSPRDMLPLPDGNIMESFRLPYYTQPKKMTHQMTISLFDHNGNFIKKDVIQNPVLYPTDQALVHIQKASGHISGLQVFSHLTFYPTTILTTDTKGHLFIGRTDSLSLNEYDEKGQLTGNVKVNSLIAKMTDQLKDSLLFKVPFTSSLYRKLLKKVGIPKYWPAWQNILFDKKGRYYVELFSPGMANQTWWVFDTDGKPNWKFKLSRNISLYVIRNHEAYGVWSKKGKYPKIVRYYFDLRSSE